MTFTAIINNSITTCSTDQLILSEDDINKFSDIDKLTKRIMHLRDIEEEKIAESEAIGYENGYKEGLYKSNTELAMRFSEYLESTTEKILSSHIESDNTVLKLAIELTKKIASGIGDENMLIGIATSAIQNMKQHRFLDIKVHPEFVEGLVLKINHLKSNASNHFPNIEVSTDSNIGKLDCIIKSDTGVTIASFHEQLELLERQLEESINLICIKP